MNKLVGVTVFAIVLVAIIKEGSAVECWECNSAHDPRCGEYNFDNHTLGVLDCNQLDREHLKDHEPKYCRKIIQHIGTTIRVIRGCGWLNDIKAVDGCYTRTGTKDVMVTFCQCEGNKCNSGTTLQAALVSTFLVSLLISVKQF